MQFQPITCSAIELFDVLASIRSRGGFPDNVETGVGGKNGQYRVSFLECVSVQVRTGDVNAMDTVASSGKRKAAALTNSKRVVPAIAETAENPAGQSNVLVAPTGPRHSPYQGKAPASLLATDAVKCAVAPRNPSNVPKIPCHGPATAMESCPAIGAETVGMVSIESRLAALQSKLAAEGRLKRSKTAPMEARLPHAND